MENAVDALKMAGAALLFIIAFTIAMMMISKSKETTDAVIDNLRINDFFPKVQSIEEGTTRVVGIETIIPTLYRYCQADTNFRVRITDESGEELQVFDTAIENIVRRGPDISNAYERKINEKYNTLTRAAYMHNAPWDGQNSTYKLERINAYIYGTQAKHMQNVQYGTGTYHPTNYLMNYKERSFQENYLEYKTGGKVMKDEFGEEIVIQPAETKIIITYKLI